MISDIKARASTDLVSICLPAYNCEKYIEETILSLCGQNHLNLEIIVVNDGSTDNTREKAESVKDDRITVIHSKKSGASKARNIAYNYSKGKYIVFFDADDIIPENFISSQLQKINNRIDVVILSSWGRFYNNNLNTIKIAPIPFAEMTFAEWINYYWHNGNPMTTPGRVLIPREIVERQGGWNENLSLNDDLEFFTRIFLGVNKLILNNQVNFYYRSGIGGLSARTNSEAYLSLYNSVALSTELVLKHFDNDNDIKKSCANLWQSTEYELYPFQRELAKSVAEKVKALGGSNLKYRAGGITKLLTNILGWKLTKLIKTISLTKGRNINLSSNAKV